MNSIPFQVSETEYSILITLEPTNIERIQRYDPGVIQHAEIIAMVPKLASLKLRDIIIGFIADDDELIKFREITDSKGLFAGLSFLNRGFEMRPDLGDHDNGPTRVINLVKGPKSKQ
jgi:hypothetical protein